MELNTISIQGSGAVNEDICGRSFDRLWVLDGATSTLKSRYFSQGLSDTAVLVQVLSKAMETLGEAGTGFSNRAFMEQAMKQAREALKPAIIAEPGAIRPSFAAAIARLGEDAIEIDCLSDCAVILYNRGQGRAEVYSDERIKAVSKRTKRVREYVARMGHALTPEEGKELIRRQITKNRRMMNAGGGYWVGTLEGEAFPHTLSFTVRKTGLTDIILCTDGFTRMFDYNLTTPEALFAKVAPDLSQAAANLRAYEESMPVNAEYKRHDDLTAMYMPL